MSDAGNRLVAFLERATLDGHTLTPVAVAASVLTGRSLRLEDALGDIGPSGQALVAVSSSQLGLRPLLDAVEALRARPLYARVARDLAPALAPGARIAGARLQAALH